MLLKVKFRWDSDIKWYIFSVKDTLVYDQEFHSVNLEYIQDFSKIISRLPSGEEGCLFIRDYPELYDKIANSEKNISVAYKHIYGETLEGLCFYLNVNTVCYLLNDNGQTIEKIV